MTTPAEELDEFDLTSSAQARDMVGHLEYAHPHIALSIKMMWGLPECGKYIGDLLLPARLNRSGFDEPTVQALIALQELHQKTFPQPHDVWEAA